MDSAGPTLHLLLDLGALQPLVLLELCAFQ
jgi:hypothetical protein